MTIHIECLHTGPMGVNTYVVSGGNEGECFVVDPADIRPRVLPFLQERGLTCKAVLLTHCHYDHILGVARLQQAGAKVYIGKPDAVGLHDPAFSLGAGASIPWTLPGGCGAFRGRTDRPGGHPPPGSRHPRPYPGRHLLHLCPRPGDLRGGYHLPGERGPLRLARREPGYPTGFHPAGIV